MARAGPGSMSVQASQALQDMDLVKIIRAYIQAAITSTAGYKALILDKETMKICSTMYGRSELSDSNVMHVERIDEGGEKHPHLELKAIVFIRPTRENVTLLKRELKAPRFQQCYVYFTNLLSPIHLQELAEADAIKEQIQEIQEYYGDFCVIDPHHFVVPCSRNDLLVSPKLSASNSTSALEYELVDRLVAGLSAVFLAVRRRPVIRYQRGSEHAQRLADGLYQLTYRQQVQVFDFGSRSSPIVLILDRRDDPVTPLLMQWTYQAMVHELITINDNTVRLSSPKVPEDAREVVLDTRSDEFYRKHAGLNFGEVGLSVKALMEQYQSTEAKHRNVESLEDMRRFMMEHMDFQRLQGNVIKHVNLMSELSETVSKRSLLEVSEMEQELANPATAVNAGASAEDIMRLARQPGITDKDRARLVALYCLRFEGDALRVRQMMEFLQGLGLRDREPRLYAGVDAVLRAAGQARRAGDLYASRSIMNKAKTMFKGLQGVDNVYTQHTPLLTATLTNLSTDKLDAQAYPFMAGSQDEALAYAAAFKRTPPREVIVFVVGGTTYEEARAVADWNERNPHMRVLLGGTAVLNSSAYLNALGASSDTSSSSHAIDMR
eukprot:CAMPEP_0202866444 /NCGR_PEP_ID=MMETSP1391-20130828/7558_1 /ASSEMBLY_ACC=CAM_ASM_000867 /TAXON_ID=1034604 /ORGANISM="Chlamydomonas leiostraca, Strain SAG 11-49" /LENGTH=607 /DNA_ID=CAMNT_0049546387 /DNA_START=64 /DNA_END=1887 /DNA_ORIENTATION=+